MDKPIWGRAIQALIHSRALTDVEAEEQFKRALYERGYSVSTVSNWKRMEGRDIPPSALRDVSEITGRSRDWLETGSDLTDHERPSWPHDLIGLDVWQGLSPQERGYVQARIEEALQRVMERRFNSMPNVRTFPNSEPKPMREISPTHAKAQQGPARPTSTRSDIATRLDTDTAGPKGGRRRPPGGR